MSHITSVHMILDTTDWNYRELKFFLEHDSSSVNEFDETGLAPLHRLLYDPRCSRNIVKLLIQHGADVNLLPQDGCSPIIIALSRRLDREIIRELLDGGVDHAKIKERGEFVLCTALFHGNSADVFRMLVEGGCALQGCCFHPSVFHCALESQQATLDAGLLKLLLEKSTNVDMDLLSGYGQSLLCLSLSRCKGVRITEMLLEAGCSIHACQRHSSLWVCATSYSSLLTVDIAKLVTTKCTDLNYVNEVGENPLQMALKYGKYEMDAIKLLLKLQSGDIADVTSHWGNNVLHAATANCRADPDAVRLLIEKGAKVDAANNNGDTPLHVAVACENYKQPIVRILLENGATVNKSNRSRQTPLYVGCKNGLNSSTLQLLLSVGARVTPKNHWGNISLEYALGKYDAPQCPDNITCCELFLKYAILDNPEIDISDLAPRIWPREEFFDLAKKCAIELEKMKLINISSDCTLFQFISRCFKRFWYSDDLPEPPSYDFDHLLQILKENVFPLYFDAVAATVGRKAMKAKLQSVMMYTVITSPDKPSLDKKVSLNYESVSHLIDFLYNDDDVLRLILAFHNRL